ncbi:ROK family transcriptional regulator [Agromyces albus]|uniref:ROK family transcriptional regulator n=1 Tax=Agromyces albus TaxID=205332 RepID=A0A4Q2L454_9MICO|nr:ROK family transcriptional regulator [Agromyces albus]RXZ72247.1 ROK family transcriptional regulator [Agromyces albus]
MSQIDPGTPTWLRAHNDRTAFRLLLEHGPLTRSKLGELSGMSKPTATQMITRLERVGLIRPVGEVSGGRGPNAVSYGVRTDRITGVAISILHRVIHAVVVDAVDRDHPVVEIATDATAERTPEGDVRAAVRAACAAAGLDEATVSRVVVGVQAAFFVEGDELSFTDTLPGWPAVGARRRIEEALGLAVTLDNDVNLAAMAERSAGAAQNAASFALFWIGDGLGVGVDIGGTLHRGASGGAGEIGYLAVPRAAARLAPEANDFTDLLGGPAVVRMLGGSRETLVEALPRLADDETALAALADRVILAVAPLLAILDPSMVVLGGPTGTAGGARLAQLVADRVDEGAHPRLAVRTSGTGAQPVLLGARQQLVEQIRTQLEADISLAP